MTKLTCIDHIETSSLCDNSCEYCPARVQGTRRPVGLMTLETFEKAMSWVDYCVANKTQGQINLYGVGEPTLNPNLVKMVEIARQHLPWPLALHLNTNGNQMTPELAAALKKAGINQIDVTGHKPKIAAGAIRMLRQQRIFGVLNQDFILQPNNWAEQVEWFEPDYRYECPWLYHGRAFIMWNGSVSRCALDAFGQGIIGDIWSLDPATVELTRFKLCETCHHSTDGGTDKVITIGGT